MEEKVKSSLDEILDQHDAKLKEVTERAVREQSQHNQFHEEFSRIRDNIIRPAMEEIGNYMKQKGHSFNIIESKEQFDSRLKIYKGSRGIIMTILPSGFNPSDFSNSNIPSLGFYADMRTRKIEITENNVMPHWGGTSGSKDSAELSELTKDYVQKQILQLLKTIVDKPYH